jgi:hypothetical protein
VKNFIVGLTRHCTPIISLIPILTIKVTAGHVLRLNNVENWALKVYYYPLEKMPLAMEYGIYTIKLLKYSD